MTTSAITCLVPTHNRPQFLRRLLKFYGQFPPGFAISVVDSSRPDTAAQNVAAIQAASPELTVDYHHFDLDLISKCVKQLEQIETPFVAFCADDDLLFPEAVSKCVEFLERSPDHITAMGRTAVLNVDHPSWPCRILKGYTIDNEEPFDRCRQMASNWMSNYYAVYRTEPLLDHFRITAAGSDARLSYHVPEMMLSQLSVLHGKAKSLPMMYSLRERHSANAGRGQRSGERPHAEEHYQRFKSELVQQFVRTGIEQTQAEQFIDDWYGYFREPSLTRWRRRRSISDIVRQLLNGAKDRWLDFVQNEGARHRRFVRSSDLVGCESMWDAAVKLMREFPQGIAVESSQTQRCA